MNLDIGTLAVVTVFVTALLGAMLVFAGLQNRAIRSPVWWGIAYLLGSAGLGLLSTRGMLPEFFSIDVANALVLTGYGCTWAGARLFDGRKLHPLIIAIAPAIWLLACRFSFFSDHINLRVAVGSIMLAALTTMTAREFWRGRDEGLMSRWPTVLVLLGHITLLLGRLPLIYFSPFRDNNALTTGSLFVLFAFGSLLFTVVLAFLLLNMTKERTELQHKIAALIDPLCGVANRRAFLGGSGRLFAQQSVDREPLATLLFDLDRFKTINDHFGHAVGDRVLQIFAQVATRTLGAEVLFGRIGGEEFAAMVPVGDLGEAVAIADRVRRNFAEAAARFATGELMPTVSIGVTLSLDCKADVESLLGIADEALYRAKAKGRNRVEASAEGCETLPRKTTAPSIVPIFAPNRLVAAA